MIGLMPAFIASLSDADRDARLIRISIPGLTDGATEQPIAQLLNALGDKSEDTEIRLLVGDRVWVAFEKGDPRYPIIVGYRPRTDTNGIDWRRFEQANFEFTADNTFQVIANTQVIVKTPLALVDATQTHITGDTQIDGTLTVNGLLTYKSGMNGTGTGEGAAANITGGINATGEIMSGDIGLQAHHHTEHDGPSTSPAEA